MQDNIHFLENIGELGIAVDKESHELLIMLKTPVGMVRTGLTQERALQLGVALVRHSGQTFRFTQPPVVRPEIKEENDEEVSPGGSAEPGGSWAGKGPGAQEKADG